MNNKNGVKKLSLKRETIEKLTEQQMHSLRGGWSDTSCLCSAWGCPTLISCQACAAQAAAVGGAILFTAAVFLTDGTSLLVY